MTAIIDKRFKHGKSKTRVYKIWWGMLNRCLNENRNNYHRYGGKGITVCERWKNFINFYEDMGDDNGLTLERIDNSKGYHKENCKWVTYKDQANNKRSNRIIKIDGVSKTLSQWADESDIPYQTILGRLNRGIPNKESVFGKLKYKPHKLNTEFIKVVKYFHSKGTTKVKLAKTHNVSRGFIAKAINAGGVSSQL